MAKTNKIEYQKRLFTIQGWIVDGSHYQLMIRQIIALGWFSAKKIEDQERCAKRIIKAAREQWVEDEEGDIDERRKIKVSQLKQLIKSMKETYKGTPNGIRAVMAVEKEIIKLEGLAVPKKIELSGKDGKAIEVESKNTVSFNVEDIRAISKALEEDF